MTAERHYGIVGGGMLGLSLALRLAQRGRRVTVYEAGPAVGGLTAQFIDGEYRWDRFYHVIDASDQALLGLLEELDLVDTIQWRRTRTLFFGGDSLHPLDDAFDYLRLPAMGLADKFRVAINIVYAGARRHRGALESLSARTWLTRWSGRTAYESLWAPLLRSKLGANAEAVSAAYIWTVIRRFYGARRGARRTEQFGYLPGSYGAIVDQLCERLSSIGVDIRTSASVTAVSAADGRPTISAADDTQSFDRVISTLPSPAIARTTVGIDHDEREAHRRIRYQGVVCVSALLTRELGGAYMTYMTDNSLPFTTIIDMSAVAGTAPFGGYYLVYLPRYVPADDAIFERDDSAVAEEFLDGIRRLYPDFERAQVARFRVARARHVLALPTLDYSAALPRVKTSVSGFYACNSAQIVNASLSVNESVALANDYAARIDDDD